MAPVQAVSYPALAALYLLSTQATWSGTPTLTVDWLSADANPAVAVLQYPGGPPARALAGVPYSASVRLQVQSRADISQLKLAMGNAWAAYQVLEAVTDVTVTPTQMATVLSDVATYFPDDCHILDISPYGVPTLVTREQDRERPVVTFDLDCVFDMRQA